MQHDPHNADDELHDEEQRPSPQEYEEECPDLNDNEEYIEVEVNSYTQENSYYAMESDMEFMSPMYDRLWNLKTCWPWWKPTAQKRGR
jgi:hypothetical protein